MKIKKGQIYMDLNLRNRYLIVGVQKEEVRVKWFSLYGGINPNNQVIYTYRVGELQKYILVSEKITELERIIWEID